MIQTFLKKLENQSFLKNVFDNNFNKKFDVSGGDETGEMGSTGGRPHHNFSQSNATAMVEERALIHEVIQHANQALMSDIIDVQNAAEQLDMIEEDQDLNNKFEFNNHLLYNRLV